MTFFRVSPDRFEVSADHLLGSYGSAGGSACCILGSGPSIKGKLPDLARQLRGNQITPFSINWGGFDEQGWGCYPSIWTSYDNTDRFSPQIFRDPSVVKFVVKGRQHEWLSTGRYTAAECPNVYGMEVAYKGLSNLLGTGPIVDGKDSFIQAIDIAIRLGFKRIFLAGCDLFISLTDAQVQWLNDQLAACPDAEGRTEEFFLGDYRNSIWGAIKLIANRKGVLGSSLILELRKLGDLEAYAFGNAGANWEKAVMMDHHCLASANLLMQSRRLLDNLGVSVILLDEFLSPMGRLRRFFPSVSLTTPLWDSPPDYGRPTLGAAVYLKTYAGEGRIVKPAEQS